jgi:predicted nucleic acid-binding protein
MPVSNSSPLIHLCKLGKLGFAKEVFDSVIMPPAVRRETIQLGKEEGYSDALVLEKLEEEGWLKTMELSKKSAKLAMDLFDVVGEGEAQAIALALERKDRLFIDDQKGRRLALRYNIKSSTTLGIVFELLVVGALSKTEYAKNVKNYGAQGWISSEILQEFLQRGEVLNFER